MNAPKPPAPGTENELAHSRRLFIGSLALAAVAAGITWSWHRSHPGSSAAPTAPTGANTDMEGFWRTSFPTPAGGELHMQSYRGRPLLLNFWAPWCPPCIHELPLIDQFHRQNQARGWQVLGLAVDNAGPVSEFLAQHPLSYGIALAGLGGTELMQAMGNADGGLPFTIIINSAGKMADQHLGSAEQADLDHWLTTVK